MLTRIETKEAVSRFHIVFRKHNQNCPIEVRPRTRTRKDGTIYVQQVARRTGTICEAVKQTFYNILTEYVYSYNAIMERVPPGLYSLDNLPSLHTNSVHLANQCDCSDRTVRNHLETLRQLGVIRTQFHGRKHDYQLWISAEILFGGEGENFEKIPKNELLMGFSKNFPANNTHREKIEKEKGSADMFVGHGENDQGQRGRANQGAQPEPHPSESPEPAGQREGKAGGGRAANVAHNAQQRQSRANQLLKARTPRTPRGLDPRFLNMLVEFWLYAWKVVYPQRNFERDQQEKALVAIMAGVYNDFTDSRTDQEWVDFQEYQIRKLDAAARYYDNHPDAYRPDPWAVHVPGKGYFDAENVLGFVGIDAWMKKEAAKKEKNRHDYAENQRRKQDRYEALLRTARRDFEKERAGLKPRKEVAGKTHLGLFHYYHTLFKGLGRQWSDKFLEQYEAQKIRDFEPPSYRKPKRQRYQAGDMKETVVVYVEDWMTYGDGYYSE